jgi:uncharacterized metal-binding protein
MSSCAKCSDHACLEREKKSKAPACPMAESALPYEEASREYEKPDVRKIAVGAAAVEAAGYCEWTRLEEIIEFAWRTKSETLGLAFCAGLMDEAKKISLILRDAGFTVRSVICKTGAKPKELLGLQDDQKVHPGEFEPMCNPVAQAKILARAGTELNIVLGLCVGHDTLFFRYSSAPVTVLAVKDRVLAHNPLGLINAPFFFRKKLQRHKKPK